MSFDKKGFTPVHINAGAHAPRIFAYCNLKDLLSEILEPGYFNKQKILLRPNSFVKVVCADAVVELVVATNIGNLTMKDEFLRASDPYKDLIGGTKPRKPKKPRKKAALAKTG